MQEKELSLKFLERALQQHESARQTFLRDLKLALFLLVAFQFVIFFPFIRLHDQQADLSEHITQHRQGQIALQEVQARLAALESALQTGKNQLTDYLKDCTSALREQILALGAYVQTLRGEPVVARSAPILTPQQDEGISEGPPVDLTDLPETEMEVLKTAKPEDPVLQDLLQRIVEGRIVHPLFKKLNEYKKEWLEKSFAEEKDRLLIAVQSRRSILEKYQFSPGDIADKVKLVQANLEAFSFTAPPRDRWWRTFGGKGREFGAQAVVMTQVANQAGQVLQEPKRELDAVGLRLTTLIDEGAAKEKEVSTQIEGLQERYKDIQSLLQGYAKPLSLVAVEPQDAVLYYPVILLAVFAYLVWRYVLLYQQAQALAATYTDLGLSSEVLQLYFVDFPGLLCFTQPQGSMEERRRVAGLVSLVSAVPGMLAVVSLYWILTSHDLKRGAPWWMYAVAGAVFIGSYLVLVGHFLHPARQHQS